MTASLIPAISIPSRGSRFRRMAAYSSAMRWTSEAMRQVARSFSPSNTPTVTLVFPISRASSSVLTLLMAEVLLQLPAGLLGGLEGPRLVLEQLQEGVVADLHRAQGGPGDDAGLGEEGLPRLGAHREAKVEAEETLVVEVAEDPHQAPGQVLLVP